MGSVVATAAALAFLFHPNSLSTSRVSIRGPEARLTVRCQVLSLLEVVPGLDGDGDGLVSAAETAARTEDILAYVDGHYALLTGTSRDLAGGRRLVSRPVAVRAGRAGPAEGIGFRLGAVDVELRYDAGAPIRDLMVETSLFFDTSPDHIDLVTVVWADDAAETFALDRRSPRARSDPSGRGAFVAFLGLGFRHILGGWDHLAFLAALILASRRLRSLLGLVTAFTVAHSITLAVSALGLVRLRGHEPLIEFAIALSIAYVAADVLLHPRATRVRWIEAFAFGLLHGLGFASFLGGSLVHEKARWTALLSFNLGVELGQVLVAAAAVAALSVLPRRGDPDERFLAPPALQRGGAAVVAALGLYWVVQRMMVLGAA